MTFLKRRRTIIDFFYGDEIRGLRIIKVEFLCVSPEDAEKFENNLTDFLDSGNNDIQNHFHYWQMDVEMVRD